MLPSALRRGITEADILHAYRHARYELTDFRGKTPAHILTGPVQSGTRVLELGVIDRYGADAIIHAMPARRKLTEGGRR
jgi:hypothetical protein